MVLSTTKMTASKDSIINANQGGGNKKAGLPNIIGIDSWTVIAYQSRGDGMLSLTNLRKSRVGKVSMNLPTGFDSRIKMR